MLKRSTLLGALVLTALQAGVAYSQDLFPPVAAVSAPADNSYLNSLPVLSGTAFDNVAVQDVQARVIRLADGYSWNGALWTAAESWLTSTVISSGIASWSYSTVPAWLNGASYSVSARALDTSSNWSTAYSTSVFHYDVGAPVSAVTVPASGQAVSTFTAISGTAWDNESFTAQIWVKVRRAADSQYWNGAISQWTAAETWNLAVGSFTWTYTGLPQAALTSGATYFAVSRASDLAGNIQVGEVSGSTFVYSAAGGGDLLAPSVAMLQPADGAYLASLPQLSGTAADNVAVATVSVSILRQADGRYWDGSLWALSQAWLTAVSTGGAWTYFSVPAWVNASTYTVNARAVDTSGNWSAAYATSTFIFDSMPPSAAVLSPVHGSRHISLQQILGTGSYDAGVSTPTVRIYDVSVNRYWLDGSGNCGVTTLPGWVDTDCPGFPEIWNVAVTSQPSGAVRAWTYDASAMEAGQRWPNRDNELRVEVKAADLAGNYFIAASTFSYDNARPTSRVTYPANGAAYSSMTAISGTSYDLTSAVSDVRIRMWYLSGGTSYYWQPVLPHWTSSDTGWWSVAGSAGPRDTTLSWSYTNADFSNPGSANYAWQEGTHDGQQGKTFYIVSRAVDATANQEINSSTRSFVYGVAPDVQSPVTVITSPQNGEILSAVPQISGTAADNVAVATVSVSILRQADGRYWDGSLWALSQTWLTAVSTGGAWTYFSVPAWVNASTYTVNARAVDTSGNWSLSYATATFVYSAFPLPAGCASAAAVRKDGSGDYTSIQAAVDGISHNLGGDTCVVLRDTGTYAEQVTVQGFTNNGYRLKLMADPSLGGTPTVSPPAGSTAAFRLLNENVSVLGLNIAPAGAVDYGVLASSAGAVISSVTLVSSDIRSAGVRLSSHSLVSYSTITAPSASGVQLTGSSNTVTYSALTGGTTWHYGLHFSGGDYNSVSRVSAHGVTGSGARMDGGADYNSISDSVFSSSAAAEYAFYINLADHNQITRSRFAHTNGHGAYLSSSADFNEISYSTMTGASVYYPLLLSNADNNTVTRCVMTNTSGFAAYLVLGAEYNTISDSVMISSGVNPALRMINARYNTITGSYIANLAGPGVVMSSTASLNTISFTTVTANSSGVAFNIDGSTGNLVTGVHISNPSGYGALLGYGANANTISSSTLLSNAAAYFALKLVSSSSNTVENSLVSNPAGVAYTSVFGSHNAVRRSTVTSGGWPYYAAFVDASHYNALENSVVRGANGLMVRDSSGTAVAYSVLAATNAAGTALRADANHGLSVAGSALSAHGSGIKLNAGNGGAVALSSLTVSGPVYGLEIEPLAAGAALSADALVFTGQGAGSRGVNLLGGTLVSTFTAFSFGAGTAFNADSSLLAAGSRVTMRGASGARYGTPYENDPAGYVDWDPDYVPPPDPELSSAAVSGVGAAALTVNWGTTFSTGTVYFVRLATLAAAAPFVGAGTTTASSFAFSGLNPDNRYYGFVSTSPAEGYVQTGGARTLAAAPSASSFSALHYSSATLAWTAANPAWTTYEYSVSPSSSFAVISASASAAGQAVPLTGLAQGATYYARVRAVNADGIATAYAYTAPGVTLAALPSGLASSVSGAALGVSSISWTWSAGAVQDADSFALREGGVLLATAPFAASGVYAQAGLAPNTTHALRVSGLNAFGEGPAAQAAAVYTLAAVPGGLSVSQTAALSARLDWGLNGNPPGTTVQLWRSPDDAVYAAVYEGPAAYRVDTGLEACTPYYYKARARNGDGVYTAFGGTLSFSTQASTPAAPGALYAEALDGARIALGWEFSPSPGVTAYALYYDNATGTVDYGAPYAVFSSTVSSWITPALASGSAYKFALRARNRCGVEEGNTVLVSAQAAGVLSGVRAAIKTPQTGKKIKGNSVTVVAEIILGLPSQIDQVRFQYRLQGAAAWTDIAAANPNHPNPDQAAPYFVHWDADAMAAGTYELRALATDIYSADDPAPPVITVMIDPVDFDTHERVTGGELQKEQKINNAVTSTVQAADESTALVAKLVIPAGAVSVDTVAVTLVSNPASKPVPPSGSEELSLAVKINLSNGQSLLSAGKTAAVTLSYRDDNGDGLVDGTSASVDRLRMFTAPDGGGAWTEMPTTVDRVKKTISGTTEHFSFFSVFATPSASVGSVKAYPNPWQPGSGGRFDAAGVTLSGLPATARVRIYTLLGELVRALDVTAADAGTKVWDGRNTEGRKAASGVYIIFVKSGSDERTLKLAVER